mgnify:CR=1 FL=1
MRPALPAESTAGSPIGLLGGTFDPIHFGHLRLAQEACNALALAGVRLIPAGRPPHRGVPGSTAEDRLAMARLAGSAEVWMKRPVVAINTAIYWHALREAGITERISGFGALLERH